jgi:hypothetical protein
MFDLGWSIEDADPETPGAKLEPLVEKHCSKEVIKNATHNMH